MNSIFSFTKHLLPITAALGLVFGVAVLSSKADDAKDTAGKGSISGTVTDKDGKAVEGATVNLIKARPHGAGGGGDHAAAPKASTGHGATNLQHQPPTPVATATTDKDGKYEMKDVPAGDYMVGVRDTEKKLFGHARVTVKDGETATADLKCSDTPPQRPGHGGGGNK